MATDFIDVRSMVTVISFITFIGIIWWAYSSRRKSAFDEAAHLPFADEEQLDGHRDREIRHG